MRPKSKTECTLSRDYTFHLVKAAELKLAELPFLHFSSILLSEICFTPEKYFARQELHLYETHWLHYPDELAILSKKLARTFFFKLLWVLYEFFEQY